MYTSGKRKQQLPPTTQHHQVEQFFFVSFETSQFLFDENANKTQAIQEHHGEERKRERMANKQANSKASLTNTCKRRENKSEEERETKPTVTANFADVIVLMFLKLIFIIFELLK